MHVSLHFFVSEKLRGKCKLWRLIDAYINQPSSRLNSQHLNSWFGEVNAYSRKRAVWICNHRIISSRILIERRLLRGRLQRSFYFFLLSDLATLLRPSVCHTSALSTVFSIPFPLSYGPPTTSASPSTHVSLTSLMFVWQILFLSRSTLSASPLRLSLFFSLRSLLHPTLCTILKCAFKLTVSTRAGYSLNVCCIFNRNYHHLSLLKRN